MDAQIIVMQWIVSGCSRRALGKALKHFGSVTALMNAPEAALTPFFRQGAQRHQVLAPSGDTQALADTMHANGLQLIYPGHSSWPPRLHHLYDPPAWLFAQGDLNRLKQPMLAIVGSRRATPAGKRFSEQLAKSLTQTRWASVSGLALGIDAAAHGGAVDNTVAVLGNGIDQPYPARNRPLAKQIVAAGGLLLSEANLGESPQPWHFPARNRIIAALCEKLIVVEAATKSGSLITAEMALDLGRDLYAVPGGVFAPASQGCLALIQQGATMVLGVEDLLLGGQSAYQPPLLLKGIERDIFEAITAMPMTQGQLCEALDLSVPTVSQALLAMELAGHIVHAPGGYHIK